MSVAVRVMELIFPHTYLLSLKGYSVYLEDMYGICWENDMKSIEELPNTVLLQIFQVLQISWIISNLLL